MGLDDAAEGAGGGAALGPWGAAIGGGLGLIKGLFGGGKDKQVKQDLRIAPTIIDAFSQAGLGGADRAAFLGPLMPSLREKLFSAFGAKAPEGDLFGQLLQQRMANPMGNEAALGMPTPDSRSYGGGNDRALQKRMDVGMRLQALGRAGGGPMAMGGGLGINPYTTPGKDGKSRYDADMADILAQSNEPAPTDIQSFDPRTGFKQQPRRVTTASR